MNSKDFELYCTEFYNKVQYIETPPKDIHILPGNLMLERDAVSNAHYLCQQENILRNKLRTNRKVHQTVEETIRLRHGAATLIMCAKSREYSSDNDKLYNFKRVTDIAPVTAEQALMGYWLKHYVSCLDMFENKRPGTIETIDEKFGDAYSYMVLLGALVHERCKNI